MPADPPSARGQRRSRAATLLSATTFVCAAAVAYQIYRVSCAELVVAGRARSAQTAFAAAELARESARLVDAELRQVLLPVVTAAHARRQGPGAVLASAERVADTGECHGLVPVAIAFRLDPASGALRLAVDPAHASPAARLPAERLAGVVRAELARPRGGGSAGVLRTVTVDDRLVAFAALGGADGRPVAVYGLVAEAGAVARAAAAHVVDTHALLPAAPVGGAENGSALALRVLAPGGRTVFATPLSGVHTGQATVAMGGPLAAYTVHAALTPGYDRTITDGVWTWNRAQAVIALITLTAGLIVATIWQLHRERTLARLRSDFVASVSHELRTPLAQIRMFAEMLRLGWVRSEEERVRSVTVIDQEARRLTQLVENVLHFSRGDRQARRLAPVPLVLAAFVDDVLAGFALLAAPHGVRLRSAVAPALRARADEGALRQVLLNLLDNAVKYGPRGQTVTVGAAADGARVRLWVDDEGPGIPPAERRRVWAPFHRLGRDVDAGITGNGIGLSVVQDLVRAQAGEAWVEQAPGGGARVVVALPAAPVAPPAPPAPAREPALAASGAAWEDA